MSGGGAGAEVVRRQWAAKIEALYDFGATLGQCRQLRDGLHAQRQPLAGRLSHKARTDPDRREAVARAFLSGAYTMQEIPDHFGVHYPTVSRVARSLETSVHDKSLCVYHRSLIHHKGRARL